MGCASLPRSLSGISGTLKLTFEEAGEKSVPLIFKEIQLLHESPRERGAFVVVCNCFYSLVTSIVSPFQHP